MYVRLKRGTKVILILSIYFILSVQAADHYVESWPEKDGLLKADHDSTGLKSALLFLPQDLGMNPLKLSRIDSIVNAGIKSKVFPGCQVLVLKEGKPVYDKCFGNFTYDVSQKVQPSTMYDLASLSKTTGTLLAIMKLYDTGLLKLNDKASQHLAFLQGTDKANITIKELLVHESGLPAYLPFSGLIVEKNNQTALSLPNSIKGTNLQYKEGRVSGFASEEYRYQVSDSVFVSNQLHQEAMKSIVRARLNAKSYCYSCLNFMLLKEIVESITATTMDVFLDREFYKPMKLNHMAYIPLRTHKREQLAPTLKMDLIRKQEIQGYVHDMGAALLGGVSGNAGLFASAGDVGAIYQMLLNKGERDGIRYLSAETCRLFTTTTSASGRRGLGFDKPVPGNPKLSPCCKSAPGVVYGHTGYTGTCCWVDPLNNLVYVFLSNRTFPNDGVNLLAKSGIRTKIQDVIYQSMK